MKTRSKIIYALAALLITGGIVAEQKPTRFIDRLLIEFGPKALVSPTVPAGIGGNGSVGLAFRDFNLMLNPTYLMAEPLGAQKPILITSIHLEGKIPLMPNFLTLLPYLDAGGINTSVVRPDGTLSSKTFAAYGEFGLGVDIQITHEISFVPRIGIAYGMVTSAGTISLPGGNSSPSVDSNNHSGPTVAMALRYTFGRPQMLDY